MVRVKWIRAPRRVGFLHRVGESSLVEEKKAKELEKGGWLTILPIEKKKEVKKPTPMKAITRPVRREKED